MAAKQPEREYTRDELAEWLKTKASTAASSTARRKLLTSGDRSRDGDSTFVGSLYFFKYDPKTKETLPKYDKFPLVIVLEWKSDGFLGLNLHYLSKGQRGAMLKIFYKYKEDYGMKKSPAGEESVNWDNLMESVKNTGTAQLPKQCLKRYLWGHVASQFIEIYPDEYNIAIQLPVEDWVFKR